MCSHTLRGAAGSGEEAAPPGAALADELLPIDEPLPKPALARYAEPLLDPVCPLPAVRAPLRERCRCLHANLMELLEGLRPGGAPPEARERTPGAGGRLANDPFCLSARSAAAVGAAARGNRVSVVQGDACRQKQALPLEGELRFGFS